MLRHTRDEDTWRHVHLNETLLQLRSLLRRMTMNRLDNYTDLIRTFNITDEDIKYVIDYFDNDNQTAQKTASEPTGCYCNGTVRNLAVGYRNYHGYVALMVCVFGTLANMLNIVVLTRKNMVTAPINKILTGLATADMLVMLEYIPFAIYKYIVLPKRQVFPYGWAVFVLFHMHFTHILHTISIAITLTLAIWRYIAIRFPQNNSCCTPTRCKLALWSSFLASFVVCAPSYFVFGEEDAERERDRGDRVHRRHGLHAAQGLPVPAELLGARGGHEAPALRHSHGYQLLADKSSLQSEGQEAGVEELQPVQGQLSHGQRADLAEAQQVGPPSGQDHQHAGSRVAPVPGHGDPPGRPEPPVRRPGRLLLPHLLSQLRRADGHPGAAERRHQLHPLLLHVQAVPHDLRPAVQAQDHEEVAARHAADGRAEHLRMMPAEGSRDHASLEARRRDAEWKLEIEETLS
ncbi:uncharacterized protein LOC116423912 isoform X1 [Nomia melanderi]|uniref:uncharacterized protein LOC116423912 isoform X1 n=1 Tax=Nomia melanderi TaxID=2448451 RepID=UPI003FCEC580